MKSLTQSCLLIALMVAACAPKTTGTGDLLAGVLGGEKGNPAESISEASRGAWFTNRQNWPHSCIVIDPAFGASRDAISKAVSDAESNWERYISDKKIKTRIVTLRTYEGSSCQFSSFTYYFGSRPPEVAEAAKKYTNPVAFAHRTSFDLKEGTSKGFIWLAPQGAIDGGGRIFPDWSQKYNLTAILTHELGHVYGVDHVPQTIMDARVADYLNASDSERKERLAGIDSYRDLYICIGCPVSRNGFLGLSSLLDPAAGIHSAFSNFRLLNGRPPTGPVVARIEGSFTSSLSLKIDDFASTEEFKIELSAPGVPDTGLIGQGETEGIFREAHVTEKGELIINAIKRGSRVLYGRLTTRSGETLPLIIEINMATAVSVGSKEVTVDGVVLKTFDKGIPRILFYSAIY